MEEKIYVCINIFVGQFTVGIYFFRLDTSYPKIVIYCYEFLFLKPLPICFCGKTFRASSDCNGSVCNSMGSSCLSARNSQEIRHSKPGKSCL